MDLAAIDLNLLLAFEALYQSRSVSKAARRLGLRQPAMSAALARLRLLLGDELFVRAQAEMQPTPRAEQLALGILAALQQIRTTLGEEVAFTPETSSHVFTIASTDYTSYVLAPRLVERVRRLAPSVSLRFTGYNKDDIGEWLDRGEIDIALGVFDAPPDRAVRRTLWTDRFSCVARRNHPALSCSRMSAESFAELEHALVTVRRDETGVIDKALAETGLKRRVVVTTPHMLALPQMLAHSDLVATLPRRVAARMARDDLVMFEPPLNLNTWSAELLWNAASRTDKASAWLRALVASISSDIDKE